MSNDAFLSLGEEGGGKGADGGGCGARGDGVAAIGPSYGC